MPVLPLIDLLIITGWTSLGAGMVIKAVYISTAYRPRPLGMTPFDFVLVAVVCLLFAVTLAARTWVKVNEPRLLARRRREYADAEFAPRGGGNGSGFQPVPEQISAERRA